MLITNFGDIEEAREWTEKIEAEAELTKKPIDIPDFQLWVLSSST
jgi:hypothetical protein